VRCDLPVNVMLRCKLFARVEQPAQDVWPFSLLGRTSQGTLELWTRDGHWRDDKTPHALDIVATVSADGHLTPLTDQFSRK
jgi:hypothetical protein